MPDPILYDWQRPNFAPQAPGSWGGTLSFQDQGFAGVSGQPAPSQQPNPNSNPAGRPGSTPTPTGQPDPNNPLARYTSPQQPNLANPAGVQQTYTTPTQMPGNNPLSTGNYMNPAQTIGGGFTGRNIAGNASFGGDPASSMGVAPNPMSRAAPGGNPGNNAKNLSEITYNQQAGAKSTSANPMTPNYTPQNTGSIRPPNETDNGPTSGGSPADRWGRTAMDHVPVNGFHMGDQGVPPGGNYVRDPSLVTTDANGNQTTPRWNVAQAGVNDHFARTSALIMAAAAAGGYGLSQLGEAYPGAWAGTEGTVSGSSVLPGGSTPGNYDTPAFPGESGGPPPNGPSLPPPDTPPSGPTYPGDPGGIPPTTPPGTGGTDPFGGAAPTATGTGTSSLLNNPITRYAGGQVVNGLIRSATGGGSGSNGSSPTNTGSPGGFGLGDILQGGVNLYNDNKGIQDINQKMWDFYNRGDYNAANRPDYLNKLHQLETDPSGTIANNPAYQAMRAQRVGDEARSLNARGFNMSGNEEGDIAKLMTNMDYSEINNEKASARASADLGQPGQMAAAAMRNLPFLAQMQSNRNSAANGIFNKVVGGKSVSDWINGLLNGTIKQGDIPSDVYTVINGIPGMSGPGAGESSDFPTYDPNQNYQQPSGGGNSPTYDPSDPNDPLNYFF